VNTIKTNITVYDFHHPLDVNFMTVNS